MQQQFLKYLCILLLLFAGIGSDQWSKKWAATNLKNQPTRELIKNALDVGYTENHGMVFGINNRNDNHVSRNGLLIVRILLSIGLIGYLIYNHRKTFIFHVPFVLILAGAIGNVIDSLRFGHVIDFIHMHLGKIVDWPFLYNLADAYVCIGMGILIVQSLVNDRKRPSTPATSAPVTNPPQSE